jgi:hypothetical protein
MHTGILDPPFAAGAVAIVGAARVILGALEPRQHFAPAPARVAEVAPFIVVARLSADVDHAVCQSAATQTATARHRNAAPVERRFRRCLIAPVKAGVVEHLEYAKRNIEPDTARAFSGLKQQHGAGRIGA